MVKAPRPPASPGSFASRIVADNLEADGRQPGDIGMHPNIFEGRGLWVDGLPDLTVGRTLEDAIQRLDAITFADGDIPTGWMEYADAWLEELRDIGADARVTYQRDGQQTFAIGFPADAQASERSRRGDALCDHMRARAGSRDAIIQQVEFEGYVTDLRPIDIGSLVKATRAFIRTGGELLLPPGGRPEAKPDIDLILDGPDRQAAETHRAAAKIFVRLSRRPAAFSCLARIARICGERLDNGWHVLTAIPSEKRA